MSAENLQRNSEFLAHRKKLIAVAYRMLGSMNDAEDIVQDAFIRWQSSRLDIDNPAAFLHKITVNLCLDRLRAQSKSRIDYVGPWVPEPYFESPDSRDLENPEELVAGLSTAFMMVLERLTPLQRAVYLSKQIIGLSHKEIAELLDISVESSRTHHRRAQQSLSGTAKGRYEVDPSEHRDMLEKFMFAVAAGDVNALQGMLASDVTCYSDGGGKVAAASKPFSGAQAVIKFLLGTARFRSTDAMPHIVPLNNSYGIFLADETGDSLLTISCANGRLTELFIQRNPDKLAGLRQLLVSE
jgi:RNA polymerase sigma factor (sigma-70 family)